MHIQSCLLAGASLMLAASAAPSKPSACHAKPVTAVVPVDDGYDGTDSYERPSYSEPAYEWDSKPSTSKNADYPYKPALSSAAKSSSKAGYGHGGYDNEYEVASSTSIKLPYVSVPASSKPAVSSSAAGYEHGSYSYGHGEDVKSSGRGPFASIPTRMASASGYKPSSVSKSFGASSAKDYVKSSATSRPVSSKVTSASSYASSAPASKTYTWPKATSWIDWKTYKSNGVNMGGWLEQEFNQDTIFWQATATGYADEWSWCEGVGIDVCGPILEERFANWIDEAMIDKLASTDINTIRIPVTYAAFYKMPGSWLYSGNQKEHLKRIVNYAIEKYNMHIIISLHSLPGGYNTLQIGEAFGHNAWWFNQTLLDHTFKAVDGALDFIVSTGHKDRITFGPFNEASDDFSGFGSPAGITENGRQWLLKYVDGVVERMSAIDTRIPMLFQDCFCGMEAWSSRLEARYPGVNIVISTHNYWFAAGGVYAQWLDPAICGQAAYNVGDGKYPVFIGEWSLQTTYNNTLAGRKSVFEQQRWAFAHFTQGGTMWTAKFHGLDPVDGEGTQQDYWSYERMIDDGVVTPMLANTTYCDVEP